MSKNSDIHLWQCDLTLHDYLLFSTIKRGRINETGEFIHNYALTYAMGWTSAKWHMEKQEPQYEQELSKIKGAYITPAYLLSGSSLLISHRTDINSYALSGSSESRDRNYGIVKCFKPGSVFRFYILARSHLDNIPPLVRMGKLMAKAEITTQCPTELAVAEGDYTVSALLNWSDIVIKPSLCDVIVYALPGRLIQNARFAGTRYLEAKFANGNVENLPLEMGYCQKELCSAWLENVA